MFSHAHIDHISESSNVRFPNAQFYIAQSDLDFWTDEGKTGGPLKDFIVHARKNLLPVRHRIVFFKDGQEFLPGVQAIAAPGHTVGHTRYCFSRGRGCNSLTTPTRTAETRVKLLDTIAANKTRVLAYHYAWPGLGHIAKTAEGFHYYPEAMNLNL